MEKRYSLGKNAIWKLQQKKVMMKETVSVFR